MRTTRDMPRDTARAAAGIGIADLAALDRDRLLDLWREVFSSAPPKRLSLPFLRRFIAFELQARRHGGISAPLRKQLAGAGNGKGTGNGTGKARRVTPGLRPGGRLVREWNGASHVVDVTETGFIWQGCSYRSLSAIARAITGAHWSGPRFFGLDGTGAR